MLERILRAAAAIAVALPLAVAGCATSTPGSKDIEFARVCAQTDINNLRFRAIHHPDAEVISPYAVFDLFVEGNSLPGAGTFPLTEAGTSQASDGRTISAFKLREADIEKIEPSWNRVRSCIHDDFAGAPTEDYAIGVGWAHDIFAPDDPEIWNSLYTYQIFDGASGQVLVQDQERLRD